MTDIVMPRLSDTMEEGVIGRWLKKEGDEVHKGDVLAEIETDKTTMDLEAYDEGVLEQIVVAEGGTAQIGEKIAVVGDGSGSSGGAKPSGEADERPDAGTVEREEPDGEPRQAAAQGDTGEGEPEAELEGATGQEEQADTKPETAAPEPSDDKQEAEAPKASEAAKAPAPGVPAGTPVSPLARRLARERGVDLSTITGTGPAGLIVRRDVEQAQAQTPAPAAESRPSAAPAAEDVEVALTNIQRVTAKRLSESASTVPHFFLTSLVDASKLLAFRADVNESLARDGVKVSVNDLIVRASALALEAHPRANSSWADGKLVQHGRVSVGFAAAIDAGLVVPVIADTNHKGLAEIATEARELVGRAREGKLRPADIEGGTFTVSNLGMFGIDHFTAIINPPQAAILAVGAATDTPVARDGQVEVRPIIKLTLSVDHRVMDGAVGASFLKELVDVLENPLRLVL